MLRRLSYKVYVWGWGKDAFGDLGGSLFGEGLIAPFVLLELRLFLIVAVSTRIRARGGLSDPQSYRSGFRVE